MITQPSESYIGVCAQRIAPKLWVGSAPDEAACAGFDVVVLCALEYQPKGLPVKYVIHASIDDNFEPTTQDLHTADTVASLVNMHRGVGRRVLVTCMEGRNRSAMVAALALVKQGLPGHVAVAEVRRKRKHPEGKSILFNPAFVRFIEFVGKQTVRP